MSHGRLSAPFLQVQVVNKILYLRKLYRIGRYTLSEHLSKVLHEQDKLDSGPSSLEGGTVSP